MTDAEMAAGDKKKQDEGEDEKTSERWGKGRVGKEWGHDWTVAGQIIAGTSEKEEKKR